MNTVKSFWYGWAALIAAGGGAYVVAKRSINADRHARLDEQRKRKAMIQSSEYSENIPTQPKSSSAMGGSATGGNATGAAGDGSGAPTRVDPVGSPSQEMGAKDPTAVRQAPPEEHRIIEKSKYESTTPFRSKKGDRFS